jgi:hypothetical protein
VLVMIGRRQMMMMISSILDEQPEMRLQIAQLMELQR